MSSFDLISIHTHTHTHNKQNPVVNPFTKAKWILQAKKKSMLREIILRQRYTETEIYGHGDMLREIC